MIAIINEHVAKSRRSQLPRVADRIAFSIDARLFNADSELIGTCKIRGRASAMAPSNEIAASFFHQFEGVIMHPIRLRGAQSGPFAGRLLPPAMQFQMMPIDVKTGFRIPANGTYAEWNFTRIN